MITGLHRSEINEIRKALRGWYNRPAGRILLEMERERLDQVLNDLFGYHILQVGCLLGDDLLASSRISHRILLDPDAERERLQSNAYAYPDALPIASDSIDVVLLPHTLEFERDPHQILREVDRVLIPEGHVVVLGFNPWSLLGMRRLLRRNKKVPPWCGDFLGVTRVKDWMSLLGFEVIALHRYFYRPPFKQHGLLKKTRFMEPVGAKLWPAFSGAYTLVARKRVSTLTPIKPKWRSASKIVGGLASPSARSSENNV